MGVGRGHRCEIGQTLADQRQRHQPVEIERGLAARGLGQLLIRPVEHDFRYGKPKGLVRLHGHLPAHGGMLREVPAPAHLLGSLSGKKQNDVTHVRRCLGHTARRGKRKLHIVIARGMD